jgi:hypothetical protein
MLPRTYTQLGVRCGSTATVCLLGLLSQLFSAVLLLFVSVRLSCCVAASHYGMHQCACLRLFGAGAVRCSERLLPCTAPDRLTLSTPATSQPLAQPSLWPGSTQRNSQQNSKHILVSDMPPGPWSLTCNTQSGPGTQNCVTHSSLAGACSHLLTINIRWLLQPPHLTESLVSHSQRATTWGQLHTTLGQQPHHHPGLVFGSPRVASTLHNARV